MMIIKSIDNSDFFELTIDRYEFADEVRLDIDDRQWLYVTVEASMSGQAWKSTQPALRFCEAKRLAAWFRQIAVGEVADTEEWFIEPNISFELMRKLDNASVIRVYFELETRPPWKPSDYVDQQFYAEFTVRNEELLEASENIIDDLKSLPPRKGLFFDATGP